MVAYVEAQPDACVKEMFKRMTVTEGGMTAVFPMKRQSHNFIVSGFGGPPFDAKREKANNDAVRRRIVVLKEQVWSLVDETNERVALKAAHYIRALDAQLAICDRTDQFIDTLERPSS